MGALKYVEELQKKKQSDVLRFLLRVRCWEVSLSLNSSISIARAQSLGHRGTLRVLLYTR